jgi:hypothetical protein
MENAFGCEITDSSNALEAERQVDWIGLDGISDSIMRQVIGVIKRLRVHSLSLVHYGRAQLALRLFCWAARLCCDCCDWLGAAAIQHAAGGADCYSLQRGVVCARSTCSFRVSHFLAPAYLRLFVFISRPAGFFSLLIKRISSSMAADRICQLHTSRVAAGYSNRK